MPRKISQDKRKPTGRNAARERMARAPGSGGTGRTSTSTKKISQGRFPGETPLTGEDRPKDRAGMKKDGQDARRKTAR